MEYGVILVPSCINIRRSTLEKLTEFAVSGGKLIFLGDTPRFVDCEKNAELDKLTAESEHMTLSRQQLLERLNEWREIDILEKGTVRTKNLLHQYREDSGDRWLFIAQAYNDMRARQEEVWYRRPLHAPQHLEIRVKGEWNVCVYDTVNAEKYTAEAEIRNGWTYITYDLYGNDSLLLRLSGKPSGDINAAKLSCSACIKPLDEPFAYELDEPNALVLDRFEYALDDEPYAPAKEILKLDNDLRGRLSWPMRCEALAQPYIRVKQEVRRHRLRLRTEIVSEIAIEGCMLALEEAPYCTGTLNGQAIDMSAHGYYVDEAITKVKLPPVRQGRNVLEISMEYGDCSNPERMYILGDFGVEVRGSKLSIVSKPETLCWGDYAKQGFPFYTGNMTYYVHLDGRTGSADIQIPRYSGAAVKAAVNDGEEKMLAFLPNIQRFEGLKGSDDILKITCLGNRYNGFGQLHLIGDDLFWIGPDSWRTQGVSWTDTYELKPMGVLSAPLISEYK